ncbi:hypothetical protein OAO92_07785 [Paracoccaceae bacterium]|nr:hypothetical protein [Paracoccaceae bacterium]
MIPTDSFRRFSGRDQEPYDCGMCATSTIDWSALTSTEKMVKAILLKAQITAELEANAPTMTGDL